MSSVTDDRLLEVEQDTTEGTEWPGTAPVANPFGWSPEQATRELRCLHEYLGGTLENPDPEVAMLGVINSHLMRLFLRLNTAIERILEDDSQDVDSFAVLLRAIDAALRLNRQIDSFTHLRLVLERARAALTPVGTPHAPNLIAIDVPEAGD